MILYSKTLHCWLLSFFFFNDTATTEIYTLSLHDALPISATTQFGTDLAVDLQATCAVLSALVRDGVDRKSTRLNSSHSQISYAVFCLKKKKYAAVLMYYYLLFVYQHLHIHNVITPLLLIT